MAPSQFSKRQNDPYGQGTDDSFWWSSDGYYVRYAVVAAIFAVAVIFLVLAHIHARRRIKRGLPPLAYHRWLVRRHMPTAPMQNQYAYYAPNPPGQTYPMNGYQMPPQQQQQQGWAPPPPAYGQHQWDVPPTYAPPEGASKVMPDQHVTDVAANGEGSSVVVPNPAYQAPRNDHIVTQ